MIWSSSRIGTRIRVATAGMLGLTLAHCASQAGVFAINNPDMYDSRPMSNLYQNITDLLSQRPVPLPAIAKALDAASHEQRVAAIQKLTAAQQSTLWDASKGFKPIGVDDIVPPATKPLQEVIHWGHNSLPVFTMFQKRFTRLPADRKPPVPTHPGAAKLPQDEVRASPLGGYNHQTMAWATGPGYYVSRNAPEGEVVVDYLHVPTVKPDSWPPILLNNQKFGRFVYYGMQDFLRGVSRHVTIGRASKGGQWLDNWFVLCREDPA